MSSKQKSRRVEFTARIYKTDAGWLCIDIPKDSSDILGSREHVTVIGSINERPIRLSTFRTSDGDHYIPVNAEIQNSLGVEDGDEVRVSLKVDSAPQQLDIPGDLQEVLAGSEEARDIFEGLSDMARREYISWIEEAKRPEIRAQRILQIIERLLESQRKK
jgi:hypothetical protein